MEKDELVAEAKKRAIDVLEGMKKQEDEDATYSAMMDGPNAGWHYKMAEKTKAEIERFIEALKGEPSKNAQTKAMDAIVKAVLMI